MTKFSLNASKKTKQTPAGEIPVDWGCVKLGELLNPIQSGTSVSGEDIVPGANETGVLKVSAVTSGIFKPGQAKRVTGSEVSKLRQPVVGPSILVNRANGSADLVGSAVIVKKDYENLFLPDKLWQLRPILDKTELLYLGAIVTSEAFRRTVLNRSSGGTGMLNISSKSYLSIPIPLPPLPEQRKIADILATWDLALETLDQLIAAKTRRKQALMQQLLTGKKRLPGFSGDFVYSKASDIFENISVRNKQNAPVLSVTQDQGVVRRDELERKINHDAGKANTYKLVQPGDFVISLRSFQGGLEYSNILGAVSPAYHVIRPTHEIGASFYKHYFKSVEFVGRLSIAVIGIRDGKQINFSDFSFMQIPHPGIEEQRKIGCILDTADHELRLLKQKRTALEQQKRGLMQQLLTGKKRVKV